MDDCPSTLSQQAHHKSVSMSITSIERSHCIHTDSKTPSRTPHKHQQYQHKHMTHTNPLYNCTTTKHEMSQMKLTQCFFVTSALCSTSKLKIASSPTTAVIIRAVHSNCINITMLLYCNIYFISANLITNVP